MTPIPINTICSPATFNERVEADKAEGMTEPRQPMIQTSDTTCEEQEFHDGKDTDIASSLFYGYSVRYDNNRYSIEPRIDYCTIPPHLVDIIQRDSFDINFLETRVTNEPEGVVTSRFQNLHNDLNREYNKSNVGPPSNVKAVLYSRKRNSCYDDQITAFETPKRLRKIERAYVTYNRTTIFNSRKRKYDDAAITNETREAAHQARLRKSRAREVEDRIKFGGLARQLRTQLSEELESATEVQKVAQKYATAFEMWDSQMVTSKDPALKGYAESKERRQWAKSMWDAPVPQVGCEVCTDSQYSTEDEEEDEVDSVYGSWGGDCF